MSTNFFTTPSGRPTGCNTCNAGYMNFTPPIRDPYNLRQEFRRRPFNPPRRAPLYVPDSLNHAYIASLPPSVQPGQEPYPSPADTQREQSAREEDDEGWGTIFVHTFFWKGLIAVLAWFIGWLSIFAVLVISLFDLVGDGPFLPVFALCSVYWYATVPDFDSVLFWTVVLLGVLGMVAMTMVKLVLGR
ncbi:hypothetical protein sscle_11g083700 [Sclerotinia sclerotiorum 1980 UF-70]|uniref:Uncharacterized protein n=1 Tax=Sclerotinia sclerotiorum (strain ATCC 18683 / 1980 / Ss-1) TaxID=665079 RepID=A0A1D9QF81_SCLS1|nr:hypothetical protein sscle_11g083700 [Sclerotinia sclerotiorum 1980 UF-70]